MKAHPTAIVHPEAKIADTVVVGPYSIIGAGVEIGEDCEIMSHVVINGLTKIGARNRIFPYASLGLDPQDLKYRGEPTHLLIGDDNILREFITVHRGTAGGGGVTRIENHNLLMAYTHVAHDCHVGNHVIMSNGASLAGHVEIGDYAVLGAYCGIHQFCRIGAYSFLGAYTAVNKDILPFSRTTSDRPMNVLGTNRIHLERTGLTKADIDELEAAFRLLCRSKLNTSQALEAIRDRQFRSSHVRTLVEFIENSERGVAR